MKSTDDEDEEDEEDEDRRTAVRRPMLFCSLQRYHRQAAAVSQETIRSEVEKVRTLLGKRAPHVLIIVATELADGALRRAPRRTARGALRTRLLSPSSALCKLSVAQSSGCKPRHAERAAHCRAWDEISPGASWTLAAKSRLSTGRTWQGDLKRYQNNLGIVF